MFFYRSRQHEPAFNLAIEEYLVKYHDDDFCFIYQNNPSVIIGKHQHTNAEINHPFVFENHIEVVRRISGGGAVFHDLGNLNFSFITQRRKEKGVDFKTHANILREILKGTGIDVKLRHISNIFYDAFKISGNAAHIWKNRVMHHGTLLFNTNLENLEHALNGNPGKYLGKAVSSNRSNVMNLKQLGYSEMETFIALLKKKWSTQDYILSETDKTAIKTLMNNKFSTKEWNYGYSPNYTFQYCFLTKNNRQISIYLFVKRGKVSEIKIQGTPQSVFKKMEKSLIGKFHHWTTFKEIFVTENFPRRLGFQLSSLLAAFF